MAHIFVELLSQKLVVGQSSKWETQVNINATVFKKKKIYIYRSIVDLQCCVRLKCTAKWISYTYTYIYFFKKILFPYRPLQSSE